MKNIRNIAVLNVIAFVATVVINGLANALPINGKTTGELSDMYPNLFIPAGLTFSIWGVIYLAMLIFIIYQLVIAFSQKQGPSIIEAIGPWYLLSSVANVTWIVAWHYVLPELSLLIMLLLLFSLIKTYLNLQSTKPISFKSAKWIVYPFFSIYLGWITVATIANFTAVLVDWGWSGGAIGPSSWAIILVMLAIGMGIYFAIFERNVAYSLVIIWALYGIYLKRSTQAIPEKGIMLAAQFGIYACAFSILFLLVRKLVRSNQ